jgi:hypothetical protein
MTGSDESEQDHVAGSLPFPQSLPIAQITLSSVFKWGWLLPCCRNETVLQSFTVIYASQKCLYFIESKVLWFLWFGDNFLFLVSIFYNFLEPKRHVKLKMFVLFVMVYCQPLIQNTESAAQLSCDFFLPNPFPFIKLCCLSYWEQHRNKLHFALSVLL